MVAKTLKPGPKISEIFLHFAGDSTMTRFMCDCVKGFYVWHFLLGLCQGGLRVWCVYYTMGKPKFEPLIKQKNRFAVLAESDSDDDLPDYAPLSPTFGSQATPLEDFATSDQSFYMATSEPAPEPVPETISHNVESLDDSGATHFRVWKNDVTRFSLDTNNIFSSPFSRKRTTKKEEDGWTSIESGSLATASSALGPLEGPFATASSVMPASTQEFPSMLSRGDVADAYAWAEKVKTSLDKARHKKMSFFRRTVVLDEKF